MQKKKKKILCKSYVKIMNNLWDCFSTDTREFFQVFEKASNSFFKFSIKIHLNKMY